MEQCPMQLQTVDPVTLKNWLDAREAILIDVRETAEYASEHIKGSILIPWGKIQAGILPPHAGRKLVLHCRKGARGQSACEKLHADLQETDIYNLTGGIEAWAAAGLPIQTSARRILPLDRQVQLTIGILLLTASLLGAFYGRGFFFLTGFFGAGLTFAGLSGFCGLARLIALMPWNQK